MVAAERRFDGFKPDCGDALDQAHAHDVRVDAHVALDAERGAHDGGDRGALAARARACRCALHYTALSGARPELAVGEAELSALDEASPPPVSAVSFVGLEPPSQLASRAKAAAEPNISDEDGDGGDGAGCETGGDDGFVEALAGALDAAEEARAPAPPPIDTRASIVARVSLRDATPPSTRRSSYLDPTSASKRFAESEGEKTFAEQYNAQSHGAFANRRGSASAVVVATPTTWSCFSS